MPPRNIKPPDLRTYNGRLKAARLSCRLTQKQMAFRMRLSFESINVKERGRCAMSHDQLFRWAQACDVTLEWLVTGAGPGPDLSKVDHVTMEGMSYRRRRPTELERCMKC